MNVFLGRVHVASYNTNCIGGVMVRVLASSDEKCAYMFNVYKSQLSLQTGSRHLTGQKTLPTKWDTYMKLVMKYQISAINIC